MLRCCGDQRWPARWPIMIAAGIGLLSAAAFAYTLTSTPSPSARSDITLVYVGAEDCAPCRKWQREDATAFRASSEFTQVTYREVKSPVLFDLLKDEHWPQDLRPYREKLALGAGVPLWLVLEEGEIVDQRFGAAQWKSAVLPKIRSLLR
jgi:hypothetical protein